MNISAEHPTFACAAGTVIGWRDDSRNVVRATGIRYARADRFGRPTPEPPAEDPIHATEWSAACSQLPVEAMDYVLGDYLGSLQQDEHCQRLSLTLPADARPGSKLPVMVWIHGGSYVSGAGGAPIYDPAALVAEQQVLVVDVTYRLGLLGFLGDGSERPANLGLLDLIEAL